VPGIADVDDPLRGEQVAEGKKDGKDKDGKDKGVKAKDAKDGGKKKKGSSRPG